MTTSIKLFAHNNEITYDQARYRLNKLTSEGKYVKTKDNNQTLYTYLYPENAKQKRTRINYDTLFVANLDGHRVSYTAAELVTYFVENGIAPDRKNARVSMGKFIKSKRFQSTVYGYTLFLESMYHSAV